MRKQTVSGVQLWLVLIKAFHSMADCAARDLNDAGLGDSDFRVLAVLLHQGPLPVNTIGEKVFLTPGSISTAVNRLHGKVLVSRTGSKTDRRVQLVALTRKGKALITRAFAIHAKHLEELASVLTSSERVELVGTLKKLGKYAMSSCQRS